MDVHWRVIHVFLILMPTKIKLVPKVNKGESDAYTEAYQTVPLMLK